jgi:hypothetical protein
MWNDPDYGQVSPNLPWQVYEMFIKENQISARRHEADGRNCMAAPLRSESTTARNHTR